MGAVRVNIKLRSIDDFIVREHGSRRSLTPWESEYLERFAQLITQSIRERWPVDTGTSRDRWTVMATGTGGDVGLIIENPMYYAEFVHNALWETLIPKVWNLVKENLLRGLKVRIAETEKTLRSHGPDTTIFDLLRMAAKELL